SIALSCRKKTPEAGIPPARPERPYLLVGLRWLRCRVRPMQVLKIALPHNTGDVVDVGDVAVRHGFPPLSAVRMALCVFARLRSGGSALLLPPALQHYTSP